MKKKILSILSLVGVVGMLTSCSIKIGNTIIAIGSTEILNSIEANNTFYFLGIGESDTITSKVTGDASKITYSYSSNDSNVATVDSSGKITAVSSGDTTINVSAKSKYSEVTTTVEVLVKGGTLEQKSPTACTTKYTYSDYTKNGYLSSSVSPSVGSTKLLVVPVWFTDSSSVIDSDDKEQVRSDIQKAYFGTTDETGWNSVKTYYETESHGKLSVSGTVTDWYTDTNRANYYAYSTSNTVTLVKKVETYYKNQMTTEEWNSYDCDGDGYIDGLMLIYAAPDYSVGTNFYNDSEADNMWAYCYWTNSYAASSTSSKANVNAFFWASYDFMYGDNTDAKYTSGDTDHCEIDAHTYIHEMGHIFGLDDYYDYSGNYIPAGGFSMQDYNVGGHDPYSCFALGWANPMVVKETGTYVLNPFQSTGDFIILGSHTLDNDGSVSPFDEYIILEYYTPTGLNEFDTINRYEGRYPRGATHNGLRIWHVDARLLKIVNDNVVGLTSEINSSYNYLQAFSNTYYSSDVADYVDYYSQITQNYTYANCNILQLIRNNTSATYKPTDYFSDNSLFEAGDVYTTAKFNKQFINGNKLNDNTDLGYAVEVVSCTSTQATINICKY